MSAAVAEEPLGSYQIAANKIRKRLEAVQETNAALHPAVLQVFLDAPGEFVDLMSLFSPALFKQAASALEAAEDNGFSSPALDELSAQILMAP